MRSPGWRSLILPLVVGCVCATTVVRVPVKSKAADDGLFLIHYGAKWGYMDRQGKIVIAPQFDDAGDFFGGRAKVRKQEKWGYIDASGRLAIDFQFDNAEDFKEGLAAVQVNRRWGFVRPDGGFAIEPKFVGVAGFSEGLARFESWTTVICDRLDPSQPNSFTSNNAPFRAFRLHDGPPFPGGGCFPADLRYGFADKSGTIAIAPKLYDARDFSEGLAVAKDGNADSHYGYVDRTGKWTIPPQFDQSFSFREGLAAVDVGSAVQASDKIAGRWGFVDHRGNFAIAPAFHEIQSFSEGLAAVRANRGGWGFISPRGNFVVPPRYSEVQAFSEGIALVWSNDQPDGYYIDKKGTRILAPAIPAQWPFSDGLTVAGTEGERKYLDRDGRIVAPYETKSPPPR